MATNFSKELLVKPGKKMRLADWDPDDTLGWDKGHKMNAAPRQDHREARQAAIPSLRRAQARATDRSSRTRRGRARTARSAT